ncbi:MAG TPA: hypothetical protein VE961_15565, partial [Pyrinomonadaceae bacterium]|nr:hypothetical protein [Pyrinomonadaceae bacterium]
KLSIGFALAIVLVPFAFSAVQAQTTAFTYQGRLTDGGNPANGNYDLQFSLFDDVSGGNQIGSTLSRTNTPVTAGVFRVQLDFGLTAFPGADRFLEISVKLPASSGFTTLAPRQPVSSTPYAIRTLSSAQADALSSVCNACILDTHINSIAGSKISGPVPASSLPPGLGVGWQIVAGNTQQADANTNYVVTSDSEATITLPATANVGDTFRISGAGGGGFRIAQNDGQSIRGFSLGWLSSWTPHESNRVWRAIASSADGQKLVAVEFQGRIYTSTDAGVSWTPRENNRRWVTVASSANGNVLIAAANTNGGGGDRIYTSTDGGANWTGRLSFDTWISVACSADGTRMVAASTNGLYTSDDAGANWTPQIPQIFFWSGVASSADGTRLVAVTSGGRIYTSSDSGITWIGRESNRNWTAVASSADGSKLVATVAGGQIFTSTDFGVTWLAREAGRNWISVASSADGNKFVAVVSGFQIYSSTDGGANWTPREASRNWAAVASNADGSKAAAAVSGGQIYTSNSNTSPGTTGWLSGGPGAAIELQYIGNGQFMLLSHEGTFIAH